MGTESCRLGDTMDLAFLKGSDLFGNQPEEVLKAVLLQGRIERYGAGQLVFEQGEPGNGMYIVKSGVLEVLATKAGSHDLVPVAYLGAGEVLGELALLTGSPRSATVRSPQEAELFTVQRPVFLDLMDSLPAFARNLCIVLARRLEATTLKLPGPAKQLQGNLRFFDLATVIQTLIGSHQTGLLSVTQPEGRAKTAEILFYKGNVSRAKVRHLTGDDAVYQLFQDPLEGHFSFAGRQLEEEDVHTDVTLPGITLLMEAVRLQDELPLLRERLPDGAQPLRQKAPQLQWDDDEEAELAASIWVRLKKGTSLDELLQAIPRCTYAVYAAVATMLDKDLIE